MKDNRIVQLTRIVEGYDDQLATLVSNHEKALEDNNSEIAEIRARNNDQQSKVGFNKITDVEQIIRLKPRGRGKGSSSNLTMHNCEFPECASTNVDLVKCSQCKKWVCDKCHGIAATKFKQIIEKCKTVYFICRHCDDHQEGVVPATEMIPATVVIEVEG